MTTTLLLYLGRLRTKATSVFMAGIVATLMLCVLDGCSSMNGKYIEPPQGPRGLCSLIVNNNYDQDIVIKLAEVKNPDACLHYVYVSSGGTAIIDGIAPGNLMMRYSKGSDWDNSKKMFMRDRANFESDQVFKMEESETETKTSDGIRKEHHYSVLTYTLNASKGEGNSTSSQIDDKEFNGK